MCDSSVPTKNWCPSPRSVIEVIPPCSWIFLWGEEQKRNQSHSISKHWLIWVQRTHTSHVGRGGPSRKWHSSEGLSYSQWSTPGIRRQGLSVQAKTAREGLSGRRGLKWWLPGRAGSWAQMPQATHFWKITWTIRGRCHISGTMPQCSVQPSYALIKRVVCLWVTVNDFGLV